MTNRKFGVVFLGLLLSLPVHAAVCRFHKDCDDGRFCTGKELCQPGSPSADKRGCVKDTKPVCPNPGTSCDEISNRCITGQIDRDGDGFGSAASGGEDCDDNDAGRWPGNTEVCDVNGKDEDCNQATAGNRDSDGDGFFDSFCFNKIGDTIFPGGGLDCNDNSAAVVPGAVLCDGKFNVKICFSGLYSNSSCAKGLQCYDQPNGLGVCAPASTSLPEREPSSTKK
ncbi:MAG: hypothetical protein KGQ59_07160 [Bdellovibrionales bacterium]|nr:hypothetical protein [Bdellovibrionales bacterium]